MLGSTKPGHAKVIKSICPEGVGDTCIQPEYYKMLWRNDRNKHRYDGSTKVPDFEKPQIGTWRVAGALVSGGQRGRESAIWRGKQAGDWTLDFTFSSVK